MTVCRIQDAGGRAAASTALFYACFFFCVCVWRAWRQPCVMSVEIVSAEAMMQGREEEEEEEFGAPFLDVRL